MTLYSTKFTLACIILCPLWMHAEEQTFISTAIEKMEVKHTDGLAKILREAKKDCESIKTKYKKSWLEK